MCLFGKWHACFASGWPPETTIKIHFSRKHPLGRPRTFETQPCVAMCCIKNISGGVWWCYHATVHETTKCFRIHGLCTLAARTTGNNYGKHLQLFCSSSSPDSPSLFFTINRQDAEFRTIPHTARQIHRIFRASGNSVGRSFWGLGSVGDLWWVEKPNPQVYPAGFRGKATFKKFESHGANSLELFHTKRSRWRTCSKN